MNIVKKLFFVLVTAILIYSCAPADGNSTGHEYIPDMGHSIAYEANVYTNYSLNTWDETSTKKLKELSMPGEPVTGTVPRGYAGVHFAGDDDLRTEMMEHLRGESASNDIAVPLNGSVPYYYVDTEEDRTRAIAELTVNPFPITEDGLARGEELYTIFCAICHGDKGDGLGYLVNDDENKNVKYLNAPANLISDDFVTSSNGRFYHSIMYGKNVMGGYADKLSYEERWQVIHHIRTLQAKEKKLVYGPEGNTLNDSFGTPASELQRIAELEAETILEHSTDDTEGHHSSDDHGGDGQGH